MGVGRIESKIMQPTNVDKTEASSTGTRDAMFPLTSLKAIEQQLRSLFHSGHKSFISKSLEEIALNSLKNGDYAGAGDPLGNFKRVAEMLRNCYPLETPWRPSLIALIYMLKQVDAVMLALCSGNVDLKAESLQDKLRDISVYAKLINILLAEEFE